MSTTTTITPITTPITPALLAQAFEAWENNFRTTPLNFRTADECLSLGVSEVSAERADYFFTLLRDITATSEAA